MLHDLRIARGDKELRPLIREDLEQLRVWRNDQSRNEFIRPVGIITPEQQERWFESYCRRSDETIFGVLRDGVLKGSVSIYNQDGHCAEFGRLMIGEDRGLGLGSFATWGCAQIAFSVLNLDELRACVTVENTSALRIYVREGFLIEGRRHNCEIGFDEFVIRLPRYRFELLAAGKGVDHL